MKRDTRAISDGALEMIAARFKVMSDPMRLRILHALESGEKNVTQLVQLTGGGQANISKHLGILTTAGMIARRREGLKSFYFIADETIFKLCDLMCSSLQKDLTQRAAHLP